MHVICSQSNTTGKVTATPVLRICARVNSASSSASATLVAWEKK
jgi:hypothetical protein